MHEPAEYCDERITNSRIEFEMHCKLAVTLNNYMQHQNQSKNLIQNKNDPGIGMIL